MISELVFDMEKFEVNCLNLEADEVCLVDSLVSSKKMMPNWRK